MKKLLFITLALLVLLAFPVTDSIAQTEAEAEVYPLLAGQDIPAGNVLVWNDGTNLYVKFALEGDWCLQQTHVAVGAAVEEIPQTKKGVPIPGQFLYSADYELSNCIKNPEPYTIPLDWAYGDEIVIAAHAALARRIEGCYEEVWQIGDVEVFNDATRWIENYADEFNWGDPAGPITAGPGLLVEKPAFTTPFIVGSTLTAEFPYNSNYNLNYATDIDVQWEGGLPFGGKLTVSWSPGQSATEKKVVSDGFDTATLTAVGTPTAGGFLNKYPRVEHQIFTDPLPSGTHIINFKHTKGDGTFWDWIRLDSVCAQEETGWGDGLEFDGNTWATYISYTVQAPPPPTCPDIVASSANVEILSSPPTDVSAGVFEHNTKIRVWKEFEGTLEADLAYDLEAGIAAKGTKGNPPPIPDPIPAGSDVCVYYVHFDQVGGAYTEAIGSLDFSADILGLMISGGEIGDYAGRNFMYIADTTIGDAGTYYPPMATGDNNDYRGFDVNWVTNTDDALFTGSHVDFTLWVANAHDTMRVILPLVP